MLVLAVYSSDVHPSTETTLADLEKSYINIAGYFPEPKEQLAFKLSLVFLIPFCWIAWNISAWVLARIGNKLNHIGDSFILITVIGLVLVVERVFNSYTETYFSASSYSGRLFLTLLVFVSLLIMMLRESRNRRNSNPSKIPYYFLGLLICLILSVETIFGEKYMIDHTASNHHFEAYLDSVVQVYLGRTLLIDLFPQYGYYAYFYNLIFSIIGLSTVKFTFVVATLKFISFSALLILLEKLIKNYWISFPTFMFFAWMTRIRIPLEVTEDPYFQYVPHRILFPILAMLGVLVYISTNNIKLKGMYFLSLGTFAGIATLWNIETGVVSAITILGAIYFDKIIRNNISNFATKYLRPLPSLIGFSVIFCVSFLFGLLLITKGHLGGAGFNKIFEYQKLFASDGLTALPITTIFHPWVVVILIYLVSIYQSSTAILSCEERFKVDSNIRTTRVMLFSLGIIGLGLFSTYLTRSHDRNLTNPSWPAIIIAGIWMGEYSKRFYCEQINLCRKVNMHTLFNSLREHSLSILFLVCYFFISSSILSATLNSGRYFGVIRDRTSTISRSVPKVMIDQLAAIRKELRTTDKLMILSSYDALLYLYLNHPRYMPDRAWNEVFTKKEFNAVTTLLHDPPEDLLVVVDPKFWYLSSYSFHAFSQRTYSNGIFLFRK